MTLYERNVSDVAQSFLGGNSSGISGASQASGLPSLSLGAGWLAAYATAHDSRFSRRGNSRPEKVHVRVA